MSSTPDFELFQQEFRAKDGTKIFYRKYVPSSPKKNRVLVIQHGIGEHSGRYENVVNALRGTGFSIYAIDSRGHGRSEGKRGHVGNFSDYLTDLNELVQIACNENSIPQVFLLGHSLGAVISALYAETEGNQNKLQGLVLSGIGMRVRLNLSMKIKKAMAGVLASLIPSFTMPTGLDLNMLSHDPETIRLYKEDPLVHGMISTYMGNMLLNVEKPIMENASEIRVPTFIFHGKDDQIADYTGSWDLYQKISSTDKKIEIYDHLYHETMNELEADREVVLSNLRKWLESHSS